MEIRTITIVSSKAQKRKDIETAATTLGELKNDLNEAGIDYDGMTFYEGLTKTELKTDSSLLPKDVERGGKITNHLVVMLTEPQKKVKNGTMNRMEAYAYIKKHNLQAAVQSQFGDNFTRCKTPDLVSFCEKHGKNSAKGASPAKVSNRKATPVATKPVNKKPTKPVPEDHTQELACKCDGKIICHECLVKLLVAKGIISSAEAYGESADTHYTDAEIQEMFRGIK